jgi:hypothetical protein
MESLVVKVVVNGQGGRHLLCLRQHDMGGTDYHDIAAISKEHALGIFAGTSGIHQLFEVYKIPADTVPLELSITLRPEATTEERMWDLNAIAPDGTSSVVCRVDDGFVLDVEAGLARIDTTQVDWDEHSRIARASDIVMLRRKGNGFLQEADEMEADLNAELAALKASEATV